MGPDDPGTVLACKPWMQRDSGSDGESLPLSSCGLTSLAKSLPKSPKWTSPDSKFRTERNYIELIQRGLALAN